MKQIAGIASIALIVATVTGWAAETPATAPATPPADPLAGYLTPAEWLTQQPKPKFKEGHTLPPLTRYGWSLGFESQKELAGNWGYCVQLEPYLNMPLVERLLNPAPKDADAARWVKLLELAKSDPKKYKLAVVTSREMPAKDKAPA